MRRVNRLAILSRAVASGSILATAYHQLAQPSLFSTFSFSQGFSQKIVDQFGKSGPSVAGGVSGFSVAAAFLAQDAHTKEQPRSQKLLPNDVVLNQYEACPFCNKVKAFLDYNKIPYKVVEVNSINKKEIKWSECKKVPILKVDDIIDKLLQRIHPDNSASESDEEENWRGQFQFY